MADMLKYIGGSMVGGMGGLGGMLGGLGVAGLGREKKGKRWFLDKKYFFSIFC